MQTIVDALIRETMSSPTVTKLMLGMTLLILIVLGVAARWAFKYLIKFMDENYRIFRQEIKLIKFKQDATDHALAYSLKNGYAAERDKKFNELKDNDEFINDRNK